MAPLIVKVQLRSQLAAEREKLIKRMEKAVANDPDADIYEVLAKINTLDEFLKDLPKTSWRERRIPAIIVVLCYACIGFGWNTRVDCIGHWTEVAVHVDSEAVEFRTREEISDLIPSVKVVTSAFTIENARLELSGGLPQREPQNEDTLYIAKGATSLNNFSVAAETILDIEKMFGEENVSISIKGRLESNNLTDGMAISTGQVMIEDAIEMEFLDRDENQDFYEGNFHISEFISFEANGQKFKPTRIEFAPEKPLSFGNVAVSSLKFGREISKTNDDQQFVSTIKEGVVSIPSIGTQVELLLGEAIVLEDVQGHLRQVIIDKSISLYFEGRARRIETGSIDRLSNQTPRLLTYFYHNQHLAFLFAAASLVWGSLWSVVRLLGW